MKPNTLDFDDHDAYHLRGMNLHWLGWSAPITRLLMSGWDIQTENIRRHDVRVEQTLVVGRHRSSVASLQGYLSMDAVDPYRRMYVDSPSRDMRVDVNIASEMHISMFDTPNLHSGAVSPAYRLQERFINLRELFGMGEPTLDLKYLVKKATMNDVLTLLLEKQEPLQKEIRSRMIEDIKRKSSVSLVS